MNLAILTNFSTEFPMDEIGSNFSANSTDNNSSTERYPNDNLPFNDVSNFVRYGHFIRAVVGCLACLPNLLLILLCLSQKNLRTKVNYMVSNLMVGNIFMCITLAAYSFIKFANFGPPTRLGCLTIIWFVIFAGYAPVWGITLVAFVRSMLYRCNPTWYNLFTPFRLAELRVAHFIIDLIVTFFVLEEINGDVDRRCDYQTILATSNVYFYYGIVVIVVLVTSVTMCLINRTILRRRFTTQKFVMSPNGTVRQTNFPPASIWSRPLLLIACVVLVFLFALPRLALLIPGREKLWTIASICPVVNAFFLPFLFVFADIDIRFAVFTLVLSVKRVCRRSKKAVDPSNFALTNNYVIVNT